MIWSSRASAAFSRTSGKNPKLSARRLRFSRAFYAGGWKGTIHLLQLLISNSFNYSRDDRVTQTSDKENRKKVVYEKLLLFIRNFLKTFSPVMRK